MRPVINGTLIPSWDYLDPYWIHAGVPGSMWQGLFGLGRQRGPQKKREFPRTSWPVWAMTKVMASAMAVAMAMPLAMAIAAATAMTMAKAMAIAMAFAMAFAKAMFIAMTMAMKSPRGKAPPMPTTMAKAIA